MNQDCQQLKDKYRELLIKREDILTNIRNGITKSNSSITNNKIKEFKKIKEEIESICDKYKEERIEYKEFYKNNFINFYKNDNLELPDFSKVKVPEKPNDGLEYKLMFCDPILLGQEKKMLEEIRDNIKDKNGNNIPVYINSGLLTGGRTINKTTEPQRIQNNEPYAIWVRDIQDSNEDDSMSRQDDEDSSMSYDDLYDEDENHINTKYINPLTKKPYSREDFMNTGEYFLLFTKKYQEDPSVILDYVYGWFKSCSRDSDGGVPSVGWGDSKLIVDSLSTGDSYSSVRFRLAVYQ